jgi:hypothetical protein
LSALAATSEGIGIDLESILESARSSADDPMGVHLDPVSTGAGEKARERVQIENRAEAEHLAAQFLGHAQDDPNVLQIWVDWDSFVVTAIVADDNLESELRVRAVFVELASNLSDPERGDLDVIRAPHEPEDAELLYSR